MCIVAIAWHCFNNENLPLVLLSNRDEFFARPTTPLHKWENVPIIAGKDEQSGGTWLGINPENGKWATVLNFRQLGQPMPENEIKISRGKLVTDYLLSALTPRQFIKQISLNHYEGFNFICGDREQAFIVNNRGQALQGLHAGLHVFSNGAMTGSQSHWFKCEMLRSRVRQEVLPMIQNHAVYASSLHQANIPKHLAHWQRASMACLQSMQKAAIDDLPSTGLPSEFEQSLSSVFIEKLAFKGGYGTRLSSVLSLTDTGFNFLTYNHTKPTVCDEQRWCHICSEE